MEIELLLPLLGELGGAVESLVMPAIGRVFSMLGEVGAQGAAFGEAIVDGLQSGLGAAYEAGTALATTVIGGILSPLGESGKAITRASRAIFSAIGEVGTAFLNGARTLASVGGRVVAIGGTLLLAGLGGALGLVGSAVGLALGAIAGRVLGFLGNLFGNLVSIAGEALGRIGGLFGELGSSLVSILSDVAKTAADVGGAILKMEAVGISSDKAGQIVQTLGFFGKSPSQVAEQYSSPYATISHRAGASALHVTNPDEDINATLRQLSKGYDEALKQGPRAVMNFNAKVKQAGFSQYEPIYQLGSRRVEKTLEVANSFQVGGAALGELGGDVQMANNILGGLGTQIKLVFAETLMPLLPMISAGFSTIVQNKDAIKNAIQTAGEWLVNDLPPMILLGAAGVMNVIGNLLEGFSQFAAGLGERIAGLLDQVDGFLNGLREFASNVAGVAALITNIVSRFTGAFSRHGSSAPEPEPGNGGPSGGTVPMLSQPSLWPGGGSGSRGPAGVMTSGMLPPHPGIPGVGHGTGVAAAISAPTGASAVGTRVGAVQVGGAKAAGAQVGDQVGGELDKTIGSSHPHARLSPLEAFRRGKADFLDNVEEFHLGDNYRKSRGYEVANGISKPVHDWSEGIKGWGKGLEGTGSNWKGFLDGLKKLQDTTEKNGDKVVNALEKNASQGASQNDVLGALERRIATSSWRAATR